MVGFDVALRHDVPISPLGLFVVLVNGATIKLYTFSENLIMNISKALKPLLLATAVAVAGGASATTRALPQGAPELYFVAGVDFDDTFTFSLAGLSWLKGGIGSTLPDSGFPVQPVSFSELTLTGPGGIVSTPLSGSKATFSYSSLAAGSYSLKLTGTTAGPFGVYGIYGNIAPVPEPENYAMFLAGLGIVGAMVCRRSN